MAEYYPLLDRAVSGLTEQTAAARQSIYERARTALIGQLRRMEPAVPEDDIARESTALDEAIARVEAKFDAKPETKADPSPADAARLPRRDLPAREAKRDEPRPPALPPRPPAAAAPRVPPPPLPTGRAPPIEPQPSRERPTLGQRPALDPKPAPSIETRTAPAPTVAPPVAPPPFRAGPPPRGTRPVMALRPVAPASTAERSDGGLPAAGTLTRTGPAKGAGTDEAGTTVPRAAGGFSDLLDDVARRDEGAQADKDGKRDDHAAPAAPSRLRDAALRPPAPRPLEARRFGWPYAVAASVVALVMIGVGVAAYQMRDKPEQVVASRSEATTAAAPGKTVERVSPAVEAATADTPTGAAVPAPVGQDATTTAPGGSGIAVAQRAALLVDAPDEPQKVKTYVGTVVWHLDSVSPGQGQPLATAVKADIDIPDAKLKVTMLMQRNPEPQLPASHTIEFHFLPQPGNVLGAVKQINVPEMRKDDDAPTGDPLAGVPVAITDNYFLVGLSRGAAESQNLRLITERNWFDIGFLFTSGKLGKLTFEKGAAGDRAFEDATKAWH